MSTTSTRTGVSRLSGRARAAYLALRLRRGYALPDVVDACTTAAGLAYVLDVARRPAADRYRVVCDDHGATTTAPTRATAAATAAAPALWCPRCSTCPPQPSQAGSVAAGYRRRALAGMASGPGDRGRDGRRLSDRPARRVRR